jgi:hypothetical protein
VKETEEERGRGTNERDGKGIREEEESDMKGRRFM